MLPRSSHPQPLVQRRTIEDWRKDEAILDSDVKTPENLKQTPVAHLHRLLAASTMENRAKSMRPLPWPRYSSLPLLVTLLCLTGVASLRTWPHSRFWVLPTHHTGIGKY